MAEQDENRDRDDLSEEASPYRVEKFRREGKVAQSKELSGLIALMATGSAMYFTATHFGSELIYYMREIFQVNIQAKLDLKDEIVLMDTLYRGFKIIIFIVSPVALAGLVIGVLSSFVQIGSVFSPDPLKPDPNRINPIQGFKKFFSLKQLYDGIRLIVRGGSVAIVAYFLTKKYVFGSGIFALNDPSSLLGAYGDTSKNIFFALCGVLLVFAVFDLWLQRWEFSKNVRVTKKEAKEEHKEHEGDPLIKARIRSVQKELARKRMLEDVKKADVIITNPTHIAVAIKYDREKMDAPRVVAKGVDFLAQKIKAVASENEIPLVENVPLARTLYKVVKIGQIIPRDLYQAVAEILAYIFKLKRDKWKQ